MLRKMGSPMLMFMVKIATPQLMRWGKRWDGRGQGGREGTGGTEGAEGAAGFDGRLLSTALEGG